MSRSNALSKPSGLSQSPTLGEIVFRRSWLAGGTRYRAALAVARLTSSTGEDGCWWRPVLEVEESLAWRLRNDALLPIDRLGCDAALQTMRVWADGSVVIEPVDPLIDVVRAARHMDEALRRRVLRRLHDQASQAQRDYRGLIGGGRQAGAFAFK